MSRTLTIVAVVGLLAFAERVHAQDGAKVQQTVTFAVLPSSTMSEEGPVQRVTIAPILADSRQPAPVHVLIPPTDVSAETSGMFRLSEPTRRVIVTITD